MGGGEAVGGGKGGGGGYAEIVLILSLHLKDALSRFISK